MTFIVLPRYRATTKLRLLVLWAAAALTASGCRARSHRRSHRDAVALTPRIDPAPGGVEVFVSDADSPPGTVSYAQGGLRISRRGDDVHLADDGFLRPIASATRTNGGWVFVAEDGATARADTFLGRLTPTAPIDSVLSATSGAGRAAVVDRRGRVMTTDARAPWSPAALPLPAWQVVFCTATRGAAVVAGGDIYQTHDGGASWRFVPDSRSVGGLRCEGDAIVSLFHLMRLTERDTLELRTEPVPPIGDPRIKPSGEALWRRFERNAGFALWRGGDLPDGAWLGHDGDTLHEVDTATRRERRRVPAPASFSLRFFDLTGWQVTFVVPTHLREEGIPVALRPSTLVGSYGVYAVDGRTGAALERDAEGRMTLLRGPVPEPVTRVPLDRPVAYLDALDARHAWGRLYDGLAMQPVRIDLATGRVEPLLGGRTSHERFLRDGSFLDVEDGALLYLRPDGTRETRPLPDGARAVHFVDARHGAAWGERITQLWATDDRGAHWHPLGLDALGLDPREPLPFPPGERQPRCTPWGCTLGYFSWQGWRGPWTAAHRPLAHAAPPPSSLPTTLPDPLAGGLDCRRGEHLAAPWTTRAGQMRRGFLDLHQYNELAWHHDSGGEVVTYTLLDIWHTARLKRWPSRLSPGDDWRRTIALQPSGLSLPHELPVSPTFTFGLHHGVFGIVLWTHAPDATVFIPLDPALPAGAMEARLDGPLRPCRRPASPTGDALVLPPVTASEALRLTEVARPRALVELDPAACVREVQYESVSEGYRVVAEPDGRFVGAHFDAHATTRLTCELR